MRSRASQGRALFRILSAQATSGSATAATSASSSANATAAARSTRSASTFKRRRNVAGSSARTINSPDDLHRTIFIRAHPSQRPSAQESVISGLEPVRPPLASLSNVAMQTFFAFNRPLLEHQVISSSPSFGSSSQSTSSQEKKAAANVKSAFDHARDAIMEAASQASRLSPEELSRTTFVVHGVVEGKNGDEEVVWPKKVTSLSYDRFVKLVDRLSQSVPGQNVVLAEAKALESEDVQRKDVESAVASALERGEDTSVAKSLGSEADLVILGEPSGPNPNWPRGVASFLAERTRALEPPEAPSKEGEVDLVEATERMDIEELARHFTGSENAFTMQDVSEDDPNLLLSHAMVQAILPSQLKWDAVVAKMDAATGVEKSSKANEIVNVTALNADLLPSGEDGDEVHMDSVKRKRRKKMRKHKYRKFRKATRVERNRLKK